MQVGSGALLGVGGCVAVGGWLARGVCARVFCWLLFKCDPLAIEARSCMRSAGPPALHTSCGCSRDTHRAANSLIEHYTSGAATAPKALTAAADIESGAAAGALTVVGGDAAAATTGDNDAATEPRFARSPLAQLGLVVRRNLVSQLRNVEYNGMRFATAFVLAWVLGSLYWDRGTKT